MKTILSLILVILLPFVAIATPSEGERIRTIRIDTPYLIGDEIEIPEELRKKIGGPETSFVVEAIGVNKDFVFYMLKDRKSGATVCLSLEEIEIITKPIPEFLKPELPKPEASATPKRLLNVDVI